MWSRRVTHCSSSPSPWSNWNARCRTFSGRGERQGLKSSGPKQFRVLTSFFMAPFRSVRISAGIAAAIALSACSSSSERASRIGEAYAGPATLNLHQDIDSKSATVAVVHHGDKLDIVGQRRRWYKVRTPKGVEGWTSDRELLDTAQMSRLRGLAADTARLPSQGSATTFGLLNVHSAP